MSKRFMEVYAFLSLIALKPYYFKPAAVDIDYNVHYTRNTFISASRAVSDYFLTLRLESFLLNIFSFFVLCFDIFVDFSNIATENCKKSPTFLQCKDFWLSPFSCCHVVAHTKVRLVKKNNA